MNRSEATTYLQILLNSDSGDQTWQPLELTTFLREANKEVFANLTNKDDTLFASSIFGIYPGGAISVDLSTDMWLNDLAGPDKILKVVKSSGPGLPSASNPWVSVEPLSGGIQNLESWVANPMILANPMGVSTGLSWALMGNELYLTPRPGGETYLTIWYTPQPPNLDAGVNPDLNPLLMGKYPRLHELVCIRAAVRALAARDRELPNALRNVASGFSNMLSDIARTRQRQRTRTIQITSPFNY